MTPYGQTDTRNQMRKHTAHTHTQYTHLYTHLDTHLDAQTHSNTQTHTAYTHRHTETYFDTQTDRDVPAVHALTDTQTHT